MKTPFRFPILVLLLAALADWAPLHAQTIPPPREATATETIAGTSGTVFISPRRLANLLPSGAVVGDSDVQTLSNKRITLRIHALTDAAAVTPNSDSYDGGLLATLSQATQLENPSGSPSDFQRYLLRIKSTTARALTWGTQYRGSTDLALPTTTSGSSKTDYFIFQWNAADSKWDLLGKNFGF